MTTVVELQTKLDKLTTNMDRLDHIVNDANPSHIAVDSATVPSVATLFHDIAARAVVDSAAAANSAALAAVARDQAMVAAATLVGAVVGAASIAALVSGSEPWPVGTIIQAGPELYPFEVKPPGWANPVLTTAGGVILEPLRAANGAYYDVQFGVQRDGQMVNWVLQPGATDDTVALQKFLDRRGLLIMTRGVARITGSLKIDGVTDLRGSGRHESVIFADDTVLEAVQVGTVEMFRGALCDLEIYRATYDGGTENVGLKIYNAQRFTVSQPQIRKFRYGIMPCPGDGQAAAYSTFTHVEVVGAQRSIYVTKTGTGWANENTFIGGNCVDQGTLETHIHCDVGTSNRFYALSVEGNGQQAAYIGGYGNRVEGLRTEGTWAVDDIVLSPTNVRPVIFADPYYSSVTDLAATKSATIVSALNGAVFAQAIAGQTALKGRLTGSSGTSIRAETVGQTSGSVLMAGYTGPTFSNLTFQFRADGYASVLGQFQASDFYAVNASYDKPLRFGANRCWPYGDTIWHKNGAPASASDGYPILEMRSATDAEFKSAASWVNSAANKAPGIIRWSTGLGVPVYASGSSTTATWKKFSDNAVAFTPV